MIVRANRLVAGLMLTATFAWYELKDEARGPAAGFVYKRKQNNKGEEVAKIDYEEDKKRGATADVKHREAQRNEKGKKKAHVKDAKYGRGRAGKPIGEVTRAAKRRRGDGDEGQESSREDIDARYGGARKLGILTETEQGYAGVACQAHRSPTRLAAKPRVFVIAPLREGQHHGEIQELMQPLDRC